MFDKLQKSPEHLSEHGSKWKLILRRVCCVFNSLFVPLCRWRWMQMISAIAHAPKVSAHTHTCTHTPFRVTFTPPTQTHTAHTRYCTNPRLSHSSWLFSRLSAPLSLVLYLTETEIHILRALFTMKYLPQWYPLLWNPAKWKQVIELYLNQRNGSCQRLSFGTSQ